MRPNAFLLHADAHRIADRVRFEWLGIPCVEPEART
jgi:hypothetical protein